MPRYPDKTRFTEYFIRANRLDGVFKEWLFSRGMLFQAIEKWWDEDAPRANPHEGLDFCAYGDESCHVVRLQRDARIPVMYDSTIVKIFDDFIGKSIIAEHRISGREPLWCIYGHTVPFPDLSVGQLVSEGDVVATLAVPRRSPKASVHPHLHVSMRWRGTDSPEELDWSTLGFRGPKMVDPLDLLGGPFRLVPIVSDHRS
jgi:hypothetical protein